MAAQMDTLTCKGCGATLSYAAGIQALKCQYCDAVTEIRRPERELVNAAQLVIPLAVEQSALECAVLRHLASGVYTPDDLVERGAFSKVERLYVPGFAYNGDFTARWSASFGFDRTESYTDYENKTENGRTRQVAVSKTRTVVDWDSASGTDTGDFAVIGYGGSGLSPIAAEVAERCQGLREATAYNASFMSGVEAQPFTLTERATFEQRGQQQVDSIIDASVKRHAKGEHQRDWHWTADIDKQATPIFVPVCHVAFDYKGKQYDIWTDGTDPTKLAGDALPTDKGRKNRVIFGYFLPFAAALFLFFSCLAAESFFAELTMGRLAAVGGAFALAYGRERRILQYSKQRRQAQLALRTARYADADPSRASGTQLPAPKKISDLDWVTTLLTIGTVVLSCATIWEVARSDPKSPASTPAPAEMAVASDGAAPVPAVPAISVAPPAAQSLADTASLSAQGQFDALLAAANAEDWEAVRTLSGKLKKAAPQVKGNKAKSKAANARGLKALLQNDSAAAIEAFQKALQEDAGNIEARNNLGGAYIRIGDHGAAMASLGALLQAAPEHSKGWRNMAEAAAMAGKPAAADASLRLLLHYAKDRKASTDALRKRADSMAPDKFSEAASRVLMLSSSIPQRAVR